MPDQVEYENCDYMERIRGDIGATKLECVLDQLKDVQGFVKAYNRIGEMREEAKDDARNSDVMQLE